MTLSLDTVLQQRYKIVRIIGSSGFGAVYEAKDLRLGNRVALKQLTLAGQQVQRAFEREARILAHLRHPALPKVSDYFVDPSGYYIMMEYIAGHDLKSLLAQQNAPFAVAQVVGWMDQLLDALDYLHNQQPPVIHRDIKPANIKLTPRGQIVLLDFCISKGGRLGITRQTQTAVTRARAQVTQQPDPLLPVNQLNPLVPAELAQLLNDAISLDPNQRPSSAKAMAARRKTQRATLCGRQQRCGCGCGAWR